MEAIPPFANTVITAEGSRAGLRWISGANHLTSGQDYAIALPDHGNDRTLLDFSYQIIKERLTLVLSVVRFEMFLIWLA